MPSLKYLVLSDLHVGGRWDRIDRTDDVFKVLEEQVLPLLREQKEAGHTVTLLNLGDTFHSNDPTPRQMARVIAFYQQLEELRVDSITLEGNHDHRGRSDKGSALEPLVEAWFGRASFIVKPGMIGHFMVIPHMGAQDLAEALPVLIKELDAQPEPVVGLCHLDLNGASAGAERLVMRHQPAALPQELIDHPKIAFWMAGHVHKPQDLNKVLVVGSLLQNDFSEANDVKRFFLLDNAGPVAIRTQCPQLRHLDLDFTAPSGAVLAATTYQRLMTGDLQSLNIGVGDIVKVTVCISDEDYVGLDFRKVEENLAFRCRLAYRISPVIVRTREYRMRELNQQKPDEDIATQYIDTRARKDKELLKTMAVQSIQEVRAKC